MSVLAPTPEERREAFVGAMGRVASSVCVVTTDGPSGRAGLTVSAMCSVSADPPLLLACINGRSPIGATLRANGVFAVNVLATGQRAVAQAFAGRPLPGGRAYDFGCARWEVHLSGSPVLKGAVAAFDCRLARAVEAGSHVLFMGEVLDSFAGHGDPLVYGRRAYRRAVRLES